MTPNLGMSRRRFLRQVGGATLAAPLVASHLLSDPPSGRLRHASFGASGMAWSDLTALGAHDAVTLVAVAEVDLNRAAQVRERFPEARIYQDWRRLLDAEKELDLVNVSTPDHMHAPIAMTALLRDLHVYGEKPLTHDVYESRQLARVARQRKRVTQMGIQIHSNAEYRMAVRLVQDGVIGKIREVHAWSDKQWGDLEPKPERTDPVPEGLDWDLWLGVCATRPFIGDGWYHPGNWRKRRDFGTGTFGDMGCHIYDPVFSALALTAPVSIRSEGPSPNAHSWAMSARIRYLFPGTPYAAGDRVAVTWYDGGQQPAAEVLDAAGLVPQPSPEGGPARRRLPGQGSLFLGTKGALLLPHIGWPVLLPTEQYAGFELPDVGSANHWTQFVDAILGNGQTSTSFDYSGPLTETVLLGGLATLFPGQTLEWDAAELRFTNVPEANAFVRRTYRRGWEVAEL